jgi:hypothetical protein
LTELVCQNSENDALFTNLPDHLCIGLCTQDDYDFLLAKVLHNTKTNFFDATWAHAPIIISNNDVKDALNLECAQNFAKQTHQPLHLYYSTDSHKGKPITKTSSQKKLWSYHSRKTEQRTGMLHLCKGMPVMVKTMTWKTEL